MPSSRKVLVPRVEAIATVLIALERTRRAETAAAAAAGVALASAPGATRAPLKSAPRRFTQLQKQVTTQLSLDDQKVTLEILCATLWLLLYSASARFALAKSGGAAILRALVERLRAPSHAIARRVLICAL